MLHLARADDIILWLALFLQLFILLLKINFMASNSIKSFTKIYLSIILIQQHSFRKQKTCKNTQKEQKNKMQLREGKGSSKNCVTIRQLCATVCIDIRR